MFRLLWGAGVRVYDLEELQRLPQFSFLGPPYLEVQCIDNPSTIVLQVQL